MSQDWWSKRAARGSPFTKERFDNVIGVLYVKDLLPLLADHEAYRRNSS